MGIRFNKIESNKGSSFYAKITYAIMKEINLYLRRDVLC